jgi:hypothetical protein
VAKDSQNCGECLPFLLFKAFEFCIPTKGINVPSGPEWLHEIKYDGCRLRLERDRDRVRLISRGGYDWIGRFPWIDEAALKSRVREFVIFSVGNRHGRQIRSTFYLRSRGRCAKRLKFLNRKGGRVV